MATIRFSLPLGSLFRFPPLQDPLPIAPPAPGSFASAPPFEIPQDFFASALDVRVPLTIALVYAVTVKSLNMYNARRKAMAGGKPQPWVVAKTRPFHWLVIAHNVLLALFSAWTFWGMLCAMTRTVAGPDWSLQGTAEAGVYGGSGSGSSGGVGGGAGGGATSNSSSSSGSMGYGGSGIAGPGFGAAWVPTVDSLCRMHGPAGLGAAAQWHESLQVGWEYLDSSRPARAGGAPGPAAGRLWNEGLAFYGFLFYLSKFYEVLDTLIILAKGKRSSVLQTYHHAGAMFAMWAGMRFMSPPIWLFVLFNSAVHALMYTYYALAALSFSVPMAVKRTLTTMQITQFLVGVPYATFHSFISYTVPVALGSVAAVEDGTLDVDAISAISATTARGSLGTLKTMMLGAASQNAAHVAMASYPSALVTRPCITTSGATLAIWLNVLYLAPLTALFINFFITSYVGRTLAHPADKPRNRGYDNGDVKVKEPERKPL